MKMLNKYLGLLFKSYKAVKTQCKSLRQHHR